MGVFPYDPWARNIEIGEPERNFLSEIQGKLK